VNHLERRDRGVGEPGVVPGPAGRLGHAVVLRRSACRLRVCCAELTSMAADVDRQFGLLGRRWAPTCRTLGAEADLRGLLDEYERGCRVMARGLDELIRWLEPVPARVPYVHAGPRARIPGVAVPDGAVLDAAADAMTSTGGLQRWLRDRHRALERVAADIRDAGELAGRAAASPEAARAWTESGSDLDLGLALALNALVALELWLDEVPSSGCGPTRCLPPGQDRPRFVVSVTRPRSEPPCAVTC
jgi:hypothetical protein